MTGPDLGFIHRYDPPTAGEDRTLLLLHGTGGDEHDLVPLAELVAPGFGRLAPRGKVREGAANRFFRRLAEGVFDVADLEARAVELAEFVTRAAEHYGVAPDRIASLGFSNGANIASAVLLRRPGAFRDAALIRPMVPFDPGPGPDLGGRRVLILAGAMDPLSPPGETDRLAAIFRDRGATVTSRTVAAAHGLVRADTLALQEWLGQSSNGGSAPSIAAR